MALRLPGVHTLGGVNRDLTLSGFSRLPGAGETVAGASVREGAGGKGLNQVTASARNGSAWTGMIGCVGTDSAGAQLRQALAKEGINVSRVHIVEGATGTAVITLDGAGENRILVADGANAQLRPFHLEGAFAERGNVLQLQLESPMETVIAAAESARREGLKVVLDAGPAEGPLPLALLRNVDILSPNQSEAATLLGLKDASEVNGATVSGVARALQALGPSIVVIKMGGEGAYLLGEGYDEQVVAPVVGVKDTVGAGDTLTGALSAKYSTLLAARAAGAGLGWDLRDVVRYSTHAAAIAVTREGAQASIPWEAEVRERYPHLRVS